LSIFFCLIYLPASAQQSPDDITYINRQILFLNESIHGFLIAHRVYENFNQSVNEYVDLPSHEINKYGNKDLPKDIFLDSENWFYQKSPKSLYDEIRADTRGPDNEKSWPLIVSVKSTSDIVNKRRFTIEAAIQSETINEVANIQSVYELLGESVEHYDRLGNSVSTFEKILLPMYLSMDLPVKEKAVYTALVDLHFDVKRCLRAMKEGNRGAVSQSNSKILREVVWLKACIDELDNSSQKTNLYKIQKQLESLSKTIKAHLSAIALPPAYTEVGRDYYYYNVKILTLLNRYGNGYASTANAFFDEAGWEVLHLIEEPHYLKVTYPERVSKEVLLDKELDPQLDIAELELPNLPSISEINVSKDTVQVEKVKIEIAPIVKSSHVLLVDSVTFELELFDHMRKDGDLVSISVNGEWIYNNISLEKEVRRITLTIKPGMSNTIRIKAENLGWMPPNTVGVKYRSKSAGVENKFIRQDLYINEVLEIKYQGG